MVTILNKTIYNLIKEKGDFEAIYNSKIHLILDTTKYTDSELDFLKKMIYRICIESSDKNNESYVVASHALFDILDYYDKNFDKNLLEKIDTAEFITFFNSILFHFKDFIFYIKVIKRILK